MKYYVPLLTQQLSEGDARQGRCDLIFKIHISLNVMLCVFLVTKARSFLRLRTHGRPPDMSVAANILNKEWRTADKVWSYRLGLGVVLTAPHRKT
jgi:hypothetical protein